MAKKDSSILKKSRRKWTNHEVLTLIASCAGRCEICNTFLFRNGFTFDDVYLGEFAHIEPFSPGGPRGTDNGSQENIDNIENIMLLCRDCHTTIDRLPGKYTKEHLCELKKKFEDKIARQTEPTWDKHRKIVIFTAPIAGECVKISLEEARVALFASDQFQMGNAIKLDIPHTYNEKDSNFWNISRDSIDRFIIDEFKPRTEDGDKIAIFAFAPQPLLVYLGWKIGDKYNYEVFQRYINAPNAWSWPTNTKDPDNPIQIEYPSINLKEVAKGKRFIALSFGISFDIRQRVKSQLPPDAILWDVYAKEPSRDFIVNPKQLVDFRNLALKLLNEISGIAGENPIHIYMALPVSMAVTLGMAIMPKATSTIILHDYIKSLGTDIPTITINQKL